MATPLFLDCDTGVDDALALAWLVTDPGTDLVGAGCVHGNTSAAQAARNTLDVLALLGRPDVPVHPGEAAPLAGALRGAPVDVHGDGGLGGVVLPRAAGEVDAVPAPQAIVEAARRQPGRLVVLATGPLTDVARALEIEPELPRLVGQLVVMGGAALVPGNVTPVAEANAVSDPLAAHRVLTAGFDAVLVPLDATMQQLFEEPQRQRLLAAGTPATAALAAMLGQYGDFYASWFGRRAAVLHDPLAAALATGGVTATRAPRVPVVVDTTDGPGRGQTIADLRGLYAGFPDDHPGGVRVVLDVDRPLAPLLLERLLAL